METVADLHLHSKYSRAVSREMIIPQIAKWAKEKGIDLVGTGDFTHPLWFLELKNLLEEKDGVLEVKDKELKAELAGRKGQVKFLLTSEISSIYSQGGKTRKIHNLIVAPSFRTAERINTELKKRGCNLVSDGRPIVGLTAKNIVELVLEIDEQCLVIPCHIWTPHFSLFGAESGFDLINECFGDLAKKIFAVETGLSSDPEMNWQVADLENRNIVSFSDAHSPGNLGREATVFEVEDRGTLNYADIRKALIGTEKQGTKQKVETKGQPCLLYTIEFYPEEGKYHYTGHRNCGVVQSPEESEKNGTSCPVCGKNLTVGVMERVRKLSKVISNTRTSKVTFQDKVGVKWVKKEKRAPFVRLVPLGEIIAESLGTGKGAASVLDKYRNLIEKLGSEIEILLKRTREEIAQAGGEKLAEGVLKVRSGDIFIKPGFDGQYGKVAVWPNEKERLNKNTPNLEKQMSLF